MTPSTHSENHGPAKAGADPIDQIGVVVIGRNESARLDACMSALGDVKHVVYVDSASTDNSAEIARSHDIDVLVLTADKPFTAARGRNAGARRLMERVPQLKWIQFIDGDCILQPGWLKAAEAFLQDHPKAAAVFGRRFERHPDQSLYNALSDSEWNTPVGMAQSSGGDSLVRRAAFEDVDGFIDDQVAHEEPEFCSRLRAKGWEIWRIDAPMAEHDADMSRLSQFYNRSRRAGYGVSQCLARSWDRGDDAGRAMFGRAVIWSMILPLAILAALMIDWRLALAGMAVYALQWLRVAWKTWRAGRWNAAQSAKISALMLLDKFAHAHGIIEFRIRALF